MSPRVLMVLSVITVFICGPVYALTVTPILEGLNRPWGVAFLSETKVLITEKPGRLLQADISTGQRTEISGVPDVFDSGQGGLLDVVVHPNFSENQLIFLSYAHGNRGANATRVARARLDGTALKDVTVIFTASPTKDTPQHYGSRLLILPDDTLLVTVGDGFDYREQAQDLNTLFGKVARITLDGDIPVDNPLIGRSGTKPVIYTFGHRNPQGLAYDSLRQEIVLHEHGPRGGDEVNILQPGLNYGWPAITFGVDYSGAIISPYTEAPGMQQPLLHWTPSIAPSGLAVYRGDLFPDDWQGDYLVGALAGRHLRRVDMFDGQIIKQEELLTDLRTRIRDVRVDQKGAIWVLTDGSSGSLIKVTP